YTRQIIRRQDRLAQELATTFSLGAGPAPLLSHSSQRTAWASLGMRQSPRGDRLIEPTLGPSGKQERLNWLPKNRRTNIRIQSRSSVGEYAESNLACSAMYSTFSGEAP